MKKIVLIFICFFSTLNINAALPTTAAEFGVNLPMFPGGFEFKAAAIFMKGNSPQLDYALTYPDPVILENGYYVNENPNVDFGYQFMAGYKFRCSANDIRVTYTDFFTSGTDQVQNKSLILPAINNVSIFVPGLTYDEVTIQTADDLFIFPNAVGLNPALVPVTGHVLQADVKNEFRLIVMDLDFGQYMDVDTFVRVRWLAGLRYSLVRNKFNTHYVFADYTASETQDQIFFNDDGIAIGSLATTLVLTGSSQLEYFIQQSSHFSGIGPRLGGEGSFHLGGGFGIVGSFSTALLVGQQESALSKGFGNDFIAVVTSLENTFTPIGITPINVVIGTPSLEVGSVVTSSASINNANFQYDQTLRIVPNIEAKLGLNYTHQLKNCRNLTLEVGYYVNHYFNAIDRLSELAINQPALAPRNTIDVGFHGPYVSLEFNI